MAGTTTTIENLVFLGFSRKVVALDRFDGSIVWNWKASNGTGFVSLLLDGDRLIASCGGYTWCLDPLTGGEVWHQPLKGMGTGIPSLVSVRGGNQVGGPGAQAAQARAQQAAAASAAG
ncbi:MAG: hypothetical protein MK085_10495 [Phycisphaerales bacterium]|nr:hypothetical protein [Phycisphaerales bacterium]